MGPELIPGSQSRSSPIQNLQDDDLEARAVQASIRKPSIRRRSFSTSIRSIYFSFRQILVTVSRRGNLNTHKSSFPFSNVLNIFLGILLTIALTFLSGYLSYYSVPSPSFINSDSVSLHQISNNSAISHIYTHNTTQLILQSIDRSVTKFGNAHIIENILANTFDIPPSLTQKLSLETRHELLSKLQQAQAIDPNHNPLRLFVLHVVGSVPHDRLESMARGITYAQHTNRLLLILWDTGFGGEIFGVNPIQTIPAIKKKNILFTYVDSLHLKPNVSHWSEYQMNYYTHSGVKVGYPLDSVAVLRTRHIFHRTQPTVEGRYAEISPGVMSLPTFFKPTSAMQRSWVNFLREWTFPHMDIAEIADLLNRVYGIPWIFLDGLSDDGRKKLLRALSKSTSKRAFFVHAQFGLGNRLRALGSAMAVAELTGRVLVLIWEPDAHLHCRFSDLFVNDIITIDKLNMNWPPGDSNTKDHAMGTVDFYNFMRFNGKHIHNPNTEHVNPQSGRHVYVKSAYVVRSSFAPRIVSPHSKYWRIMRERLVPQVEIMTIVHDPSFVNIRRMIGVHIRSRTIENDIKGVSEDFYGSGSQTTDYWRRRTGLNTFKVRIKRLSPRYKFFVAADDRTVIKELEQEFGAHRIFSVPRDEDCVTRDEECAKLALADILLLSKVPILLGSHWSSFTEAAVRLSGRVKVLLAGVHFGHKK